MKKYEKNIMQRAAIGAFMGAFVAEIVLKGANLPKIEIEEVKKCSSRQAKQK